MNMSNITSDLETAAQRIEADANYRVLRAVPPRFTNMPGGPPPDGTCVAIVDIETTGLDIEHDKIIELAIMLVFVDDDAKVLGHLGPLSWLEDPEVELDPRISLLTGLANHHLIGHSIDDDQAQGLLERADIMVAHNSQFDARWIEKRYPDIANKPWGCSCRDIDWLKLNYDGRAQQSLLMQAGYFANAHRAGDDVWSLFHLLNQTQRDIGGDEERSHLARVIEAVNTDTVLVEAVHAPYAAKDRLKARSYRWNPDKKVWSKEMREQDLIRERGWFRKMDLPDFRTSVVTALERHR